MNEIQINRYKIYRNIVFHFHTQMEVYMGYISMYDNFDTKYDISFKSI